MNVIPSLEDLYVVVSLQQQGNKLKQEDSIAIFDSQCLALAEGVEVMNHGHVASEFACETAIWCYKHVRQRPYYWDDKIKLLHRIFKTTNLSLWQKRKEKIFSDGLASTLCITILGPVKIWVGVVGNSRIYLIREGLVEELVPPESQQSQIIPMALGFVRSGIIPRCASERMISGDLLLLCSDGVSDFISEEDIRICSEFVEVTKDSCMKAVGSLLSLASERGSNENASVCMIKKR